MRSRQSSRLLFHRSGGCVKAVSLRSSSLSGLQSSSLQSLSALERRRIVGIGFGIVGVQQLQTLSSVSQAKTLLGHC